MIIRPPPEPVCALCRVGSPLVLAQRPAVFFDRDGVLNKDRGYTHRVDDLEWMPGAIEAIRAANAARYWVVVVTNQGGIARGHYDVGAADAFHAEMQRQLARHDAAIDVVALCPHHPDGVVREYSVPCGCRKPAPGLIVTTMNRWPIRHQGSFLIGDRTSDLEAAAASGMPGVLYSGGDLRNYLGFLE